MGGEGDTGLAVHLKVLIHLVKFVRLLRLDDHLLAGVDLVLLVGLGPREPAGHAYNGGLA